MPVFKQVLLLVSVMALLMPSTRSFADDHHYLKNTQYLVSDESSEVIKVTRLADLDDTNFDVNRTLYVIQICDAQIRSKCHDLIPGRTQFTSGELNAALAKSSGSKSGSKADTALTVGGSTLTLLKKPIARGLGKLLDRTINPKAILLAGLAVIGAGVVESVRNTPPVDPLLDVQNVPSISPNVDDSPDAKVLDLAATETALKPLLNNTAVSPANPI